jgi:hypothetical protein
MPHVCVPECSCSLPPVHMLDRGKFVSKYFNIEQGSPATADTSVVSGMDVLGTGEATTCVAAQSDAFLDSVAAATIASGLAVDASGSGQSNCSSSLRPLPVSPSRGLYSPTTGRTYTLKTPEQYAKVRLLRQQRLCFISGV